MQVFYAVLCCAMAWLVLVCRSAPETHCLLLCIDDIHELTLCVSITVSIRLQWAMLLLCVVSFSSRCTPIYAHHRRIVDCATPAEEVPVS